MPPNGAISGVSSDPVRGWQPPAAFGRSGGSRFTAKWPSVPDQGPERTFLLSWPRSALSGRGRPIILAHPGPSASPFMRSEPSFQRRGSGRLVLYRGRSRWTRSGDRTGLDPLPRPNGRFAGVLPKDGRSGQRSERLPPTSRPFGLGNGAGGPRRCPASTASFSGAGSIHRTVRNIFPFSPARPSDTHVTGGIFPGGTYPESRL